MLVILNGIDDSLRGYDIARKLDIRLCSADDFTFLILIIILSICQNVNRTDDITVKIIAYDIIAELCQTVISVILKTKVRRIGYVACSVVGESFGGNNRIIEQILNSS